MCSSRMRPQALTLSSGGSLSDSWSNLKLKFVPQMKASKKYYPFALRARCADMSLSDASSPTPVYNDNQGCVDWSKTTSMKGLRHLNFRDCAVCDSVLAEEVTIHHIQGIINPADIFTKEMKDGLHFRTLRDSFMMSRESFRTFISAAQLPVSASWVSGITLTCL